MSSSARTSASSGLSHVSPSNTPRMVDVADKAASRRSATARSSVKLPTFIMDELLRVQQDAQASEIRSKKGPVVTTAIVAGVMAAKKTSELIPFCHPIAIENCAIDITPVPEESRLLIECTVVTSGKTGVEMEALVGCSLASLTIYDMLKAMSHDIVIEETRLVKKTGGKSDLHLERSPQK
ncbi:MAG: cyclic pyranopterin monophosphate synthase MoaC [archaeon]|nr:cyclic pyranopterin monophosphate synthase MoaC [archaeon]